ncbi:flagellin lysine-N-methylase [Tistrella bauzanensis]|uniref:Flagellin lysine-N-methylase n=1 Tax=Tistrella arctica TaxID=3133430 RepID=A0ABU9YIA0_9PROT
MTPTQDGDATPDETGADEGAIRVQPVLDDFACIGAACSDTCCAGWSMQVDDATLARWQGVFTAAEQSAMTMVDADAGRVMARAPSTGACVKLDQGWCAIHRSHGHEMLSKACAAFPRRVTTDIDGVRRKIAQLGCPEVVRLAVAAGSGAGRTGVRAGEDGITATFCALLPGRPASDRMRAVLALAGSIARFPMPDRPAAATALGRGIHDRLPAPATDPLDEPRLLLTLGAVLHATGGHRRPALDQAMQRLEAALGLTLDRATLDLTGRPDADPEALARARDTAWDVHAAGTGLDAALSAWIDHQLAASPHSPTAAPLPTTTPEALPGLRLAIGFAVARLVARMAALGVAEGLQTSHTARDLFIADAAVFSRLLDHLSRPALLDGLATECGWTTAARLHGLVGPSRAG